MSCLLNRPAVGRFIRIMQLNYPFSNRKKKHLYHKCNYISISLTFTFYRRLNFVVHISAPQIVESTRFSGELNSIVVYDEICKRALVALFALIVFTADIKRKTSSWRLVGGRWSRWFATRASITLIRFRGEFSYCNVEKDESLAEWVTSLTRALPVFTKGQAFSLTCSLWRNKQRDYLFSASLPFRDILLWLPSRTGNAPAKALCVFSFPAASCADMNKEWLCFSSARRSRVVIITHN